uniref:MaoC-like domain-containing protein n=2 Tax=Aegilops tauschii TaxID=37682 RepID=A0A453AFI9_AEGTS
QESPAGAGEAVRGGEGIDDGRPSGAAEGGRGAARAPAAVHGGCVAAYAGVSGDRTPVHLDNAFARGTGGFQRGRVVHGMLVASFFPALIASHVPGAVYVSQSLKFTAPVHVGDEVVAQVQALHIKATGARHVVKFATKCFTDDEETLAIDGEAMTFLPTLQLSAEAIE